MYLVKRLCALLFVLNFAACKKEKLYFQKVEIIESNTTSRLNRIQFLNDSVCIIAGGVEFDIAEVLRSTDGGYTWHSHTDFPNTGKGQYGFDIAPSGNIWLSGFDGTVLSSSDNGINWTEKRLGNWKFHVALSFANDNRIVLVNTGAQKEGSIVVADTNAQILKTTEFQFGLNDVQMVNESTGYVAGYGAILKTTDGGDTWTILDVKNDNFNALACISENDVFATGYNGSIVHTTDGGKSWKRLRNGNNIIQTRYHLENIRFKDASTGWAVGEDGLVIYTTDGGNNWTKYNKFTDVALLDLSFCPDGKILVVGEAGKIYKLTP